MSTESRTRARRIREGLCSKCGVDRGKDGTGTMCRPCANKANHRMLKNRANYNPDRPRNADGYIVLDCENCFEKFPWKGSGQRVFCDSCLPWFADDHTETQQQKAANRVSTKHIPLSAENLIDSWGKQ